MTFGYAANTNRFPAGYTPAYRPGVKDTSIAAHRDNKDAHVTMAQRIHAYLLSRPRWFSRAELARDLGVPTATMSGRVNQLVKEGKATEGYGQRIACPVTGRNVRGLRAA